MPGYKALIVHVHAWVCAGDGLHLRPSSMSVRACVSESTYVGNRRIILYSWRHDIHGDPMLG